MACSPLAAQVTSTVPPTGTPAPAAPPVTPDQRMQKASADVRQVSEQLSKMQLPMNVEPAFSFRP